MDRATETVEEHFFGDSDLVVESLSPDNKDDFAKYLLETDRVSVARSTNRNMMRSFKQTTGMKTRREKKADEEAQQSIDDTDTYFLIRDDSRFNPIVGHAMNVEEGRATELRIEIFDENYHGLRGEDGRSLYDILTELRLRTAKGTPYVCNMSPKAQYKMEKLEYGEGEFEILKWAPAFKDESEQGVLMAFADGRREDEPEKLYVPETEGDFLSEFVEETLESFYGENSTDISSDIDYEDFDDFDNFNGLRLDRQEAAIGKECLKVTGGGEMSVQEIYEEIAKTREKDRDVEIRVDAEQPMSLKVSEKLLDDRWIPTGYVPDIGGGYDSHELSFFYPESGYDFAITEEVADHFDEFGIPYRKKDPDHSFTEMKSVPVEVGALSRDISPDTALHYSDLYRD